MNEKTAAVVSGVGTAEAVARYLPANYKIVIAAEGNGRVLAMVEGTDEAGWTLDDYVLPRLASGLYVGAEMDANTAYLVVSGARALVRS